MVMLFIYALGIKFIKKIKINMSNDYTNWGTIQEWILIILSLKRQRMEILGRT